MKKVIVLGGSGMLGSMAADVLSRDDGLNVSATVREPELLSRCRTSLPRVQWLLFDATGTGDPALLRDYQWIVNAIGITKPLIRDDNAFEIERAIRVNSLFPQWLAQNAEANGTRVLQIATDCVYSGSKGSYLETDLHDALDVYGKTKSLGESVRASVHNLRCSIIGPEPKEFKFLVEWFVRQADGATVNGFTNHRWNGVTTYHFARAALAIIRNDLPLRNLQHLVPSGDVTKADMLRVFADAYGRHDIKIREVAADKIIDRTLATAHPEANAEIWRLAGYAEPPTVPQMIHEMAQNPNLIAAA